MPYNCLSKTKIKLEDGQKREGFLYICIKKEKHKTIIFAQFEEAQHLFFHYNFGWKILWF